MVFSSPSLNQQRLRVNVPHGDIVCSKQSTIFVAIIIVSSTEPKVVVREQFRFEQAIRKLSFWSKSRHVVLEQDMSSCRPGGAGQVEMPSWSRIDATGRPEWSANQQAGRIGAAGRPAGWIRRPARKAGITNR